MAAQKGSVGDWIQIAASVEPELAASPREERHQVLSRASKRFGRHPSTIHRMVRAYRYALSRAKSIGLEVSEIAAAVVSLEVLDRLERKGNPLSPDLRKEVLLGRVSFRQLLEEESTSKRVIAKKRPPLVVHWHKFVCDLARDLSLCDIESLSVDPNRMLHSQTAQNLSVDWEAKLKGQNVALFVSPQIAYSESRGRSIIDQLSKVVMATLFYNRVIYLVMDKAEAALVENYLPQREIYQRLLPAPIEIVIYMDTCSGRLNGDFYRA